MADQDSKQFYAYSFMKPGDWVRWSDEYKAANPWKFDKPDPGNPWRRVRKVEREEFIAMVQYARWAVYFEDSEEPVRFFDFEQEEVRRPFSVR